MHELLEEGVAVTDLNAQQFGQNNAPRTLDEMLAADAGKKRPKSYLTSPRRTNKVNPNLRKDK